MSKPTLKRGLGLVLLTLYGLGTTIGAGIYVLVGEVAGVAGYLAPVAFLVAAVLAGFSALSFAELSVRYPVSAGEAAYVNEGFGKAWLATLVGLLVVAAGTVSSGAIINGFVGYFHTFIAWPAPVIILLVAVLLAALASWGIVESVGIAALVTLFEIGGLVLILAVGWPYLAQGLPTLPAAMAATPLPLSAIFIGAALAFYAFIGFEDMVNVAEEVKEVRTTMPRAIILTLAITALLYVLVAVTAVSVMPAGELAQKAAPLAAIYTRATGSEPYLISLIGVVAVLNGALIQIIMAARILYGLAERGRIPAGLSKINRITRTPVRATALVGGMVLVLALALPLLTLAQFTSAITLSIFALVNLSLVAIKWRGRGKGLPRPGFQVPLWVPVVGTIISAAFAALQVVEIVG